MKSLSLTLLAAQKSASAKPFVKAVLKDYYSEGSRARFQRWYAGAESPSPITSVIAADGGLLRARNDSGTLYVSRVAAPQSGSPYSSWSSEETVFAGTGVALVRMPDDELWLFYIETDHTTIELKVSTDDGATWDTGTAAISAGGSKDHLAASVNPSGDVVLFWNEGASVHSSRWNGSSWSAPTAWSRSAASITGVSAFHDGDFQLVLTGTETSTNSPMVWAVRYGDGFAIAADTWGFLRTVTEASAGSGIGFANPAVVLYGGLWRLFFVESYSGDAAYDRLQYATKYAALDFNINDWREAVGFDFEGNVNGVSSALVGVGSLFLVASNGVWNAVPIADLDVSADVVEAGIDQDTNGARVWVELDNSAGNYAPYGSGIIEALQRGARLELTPGYTTSTGNEVNSSREYAYWVESVELTTGASPRLVLTAHGGEWLLGRWRARRQYVFPSGSASLASVAFFVAARAGFPLITSGSSSTPWNALTPAFTISPGESGFTAIGRLVERVTDVVYFDAGVLVTKKPDPGGTSSYAFGPADHPILEGRYRDTGRNISRARVIGDGVYAESFDFNEIRALGESIETVLDQSLTDADDAEERAEAVLRGAALAAGNDRIRIFGVHCGVELYDVVSVTDAAAGLSAETRRVRGYAWRFSRGLRPRYDMTLTLGEV